MKITACSWIAEQKTWQYFAALQSLSRLNLSLSSSTEGLGAAFSLSSGCARVAAVQAVASGQPIWVVYCCLAPQHPVGEDKGARAEGFVGLASGKWYVRRAKGRRPQQTAFVSATALLLQVRPKGRSRSLCWPGLWQLWGMQMGRPLLKPSLIVLQVIPWGRAESSAGLADRRPLCWRPLTRQASHTLHCTAGEAQGARQGGPAGLVGGCGRAVSVTHSQGGGEACHRPGRAFWGQRQAGAGGYGAVPLLLQALPGRGGQVLGQAGPQLLCGTGPQVGFLKFGGLHAVLCIGRVA